MTLLTSPMASAALTGRGTWMVTYPGTGVAGCTIMKPKRVAISLRMTLSWVLTKLNCMVVVGSTPGRVAGVLAGADSWAHVAEVMAKASRVERQRSVEGRVRVCMGMTPSRGRRLGAN